MEKGICAICGKEGIVSAKKEEGGLDACTLSKIACKRPFFACREGHSKTAEGLLIQRANAEKKEKHDGFKLGSGCFKCSICGKLTRKTNQGNCGHCPKCDEIAMHENSHADNDYPNDDCGEKDCPVKNYTKEQRWWIHDEEEKTETKEDYFCPSCHCETIEWHKEAGGTLIPFCTLCQAKISSGLIVVKEVQ